MRTYYQNGISDLSFGELALFFWGGGVVGLLVAMRYFLNTLSVTSTMYFILVEVAMYMYILMLHISSIG